MNPKLFWLRDEAKRPVACIASVRDEHHVTFALSACHGSKDPFNKARGRSIAIGRLLTSKKNRFVIATSTNPKREVLEFLANNPINFHPRVAAAAQYQLQSMFARQATA